MLVAVAVGAAVWFAISSAGGSADPDVVRVDEGDTAALSGRIYDSAGRPLAGAHVFAGPAAVVAGGDGRFSFSQLPAKKLPIDATADGHVRAGVDDLGRPVVDLEDGRPVDDLELFLPRAARASGRIVAGGAPVEHADISLSYVFAEGLDGSELDPFIVSDVTRTDQDGKFEISRLAPGRLQFLVDSDEHEFAESAEFYFRPGHRRTDIVVDIAPAGALYGAVVDSDDRGVLADITVEPDHPGRSALRTATNRDGLFLLSNLDEGTYSLYVEADNHSPKHIDTVRVRANDVTELDITLDDSRGIFGRVVEPDGTAVVGARVQLDARHDDDRRRLRTDHHGHFEWADAPDGEWTAVAASPSHDASAKKPVRRDEETVLEVTPGGEITGRVVDSAGEPFTDHFEIGVANADLDGPEHATFHPRRMPREDIIDDQGQFQFGPLQSGLYRLVVITDGHAPTSTDGLRVSAGSTTGPITIELEGGSTLAGTVRDLDTGDPVEGADVSFLLRRPDGRAPSTTTDADGHYELHDLPAGRSSLRIVHDRYIFEMVSGVDVPADGHLDYDIDLEPIGDGQPGQIFQGIGASLRSADGGFEIAATHDDAPAVRAGLREGDVITAVDGTSVQDMTVDQVVEYIRGAPGTEVSLEVDRTGRGTRTIDVERERVFLPQQRQVRTR